MNTPRNQTLKPFSKNQTEEDEGLGDDHVETPIGKSHGTKAAKAKEPTEYKLLTADAIIDGVKYSKHFDQYGGHYGLFKLSADRIDALMADGIMFAPVEPE